MQNLKEIVLSAQKLVRCLYDCLSDDCHLQRDRPIFVRLQCPALQVVATLANAYAATGATYKQRGISFAKSHLSEFSAILETAKQVGSLGADSFSLLYDASNEVETALSGGG